jgi:hypothetical protein
MITERIAFSQNKHTLSRIQVRTAMIHFFGTYDPAGDNSLECADRSAHSKKAPLAHVSIVSAAGKVYKPLAISRTLGGRFRVVFD